MTKAEELIEKFLHENSPKSDDELIKYLKSLGATKVDSTDEDMTAYFKDKETLKTAENSLSKKWSDIRFSTSTDGGKFSIYIS